MSSIEVWSLAFLMERRLTADEAGAVVKTAKNDSRFTFLEDLWHEDETVMSSPMQHRVRELLRKKVLAWMDRYAEKHPARCLFTGHS